MNRCSLTALPTRKYFSGVLYEGGITGVEQDGDDDSDEYYDGNTDEDPDKPPVIALDPTSARSKIAVVNPPEHPVELPGVAPPENEIDDNVVPPLFPNDHYRDNETDDDVKVVDTSTQQL